MLRVRVEIVPWGLEYMAEEIACLVVGNVTEDSVDGRYQGTYEVRDGDAVIGRFRLHRYGWYRNRLGLAARALRMLQLRRDRGKCLPSHPPVGDREAYVRRVVA